MNDFVDIKLSRQSLDKYFIRKSIFEAVEAACGRFNGRLLDVGCGKMPYRELILEKSKIDSYIGLDIDGGIVYDKTVKPDFFWDGVKMPFEDGSFDSIMATEVLEHCPEPKTILNEIARVLKPGGVFFFTVPFLWNLHEAPHDEYRYTPFALKRLLDATGFDHIEINAGGGWHASMAQMLGLWVRRSPLNKSLRSLLSALIMPFYKYLLKKDKPPTTFKSRQMITNIYGFCKQP